MITSPERQRHCALSDALKGRGLLPVRFCLSRDPAVDRWLGDAKFRSKSGLGHLGLFQIYSEL